MSHGGGCEDDEECVVLLVFFPGDPVMTRG